MNCFAKLLGITALCAGAMWQMPSAADACGKYSDFEPVVQEGKDIDVVLCLDVSGSMQGLVDQAKNKLWDIVNELAKIKPAPNLRVALYSYGHDTYDAKKGWVRKEIDLTTDLDSLYKKLFALTINGGTEYVTRVSTDAIREQKWSEKKDALKLIFVAGNEPANQDPTVSLKRAAEAAKAKGIIINPIYCGGADDGDARTWRELATLAGGRFANIDQNQRVVVATPMDKELGELGVKLNSTYVAYGKDKWKGKNQMDQTANSAKQGASALSGRVTYQNSGLYRCDDWCLVDRMKADPKFDITKLKDEELSDELKKMTVEQRVKFVKDKAAQREALQKQITTLSQKRDEFIREELKRNPNSAQAAFDAAIRETLRIQGKERGIELPK